MRWCAGVWLAAGPMKLDWGFWLGSQQLPARVPARILAQLQPAQPAADCVKHIYKCISSPWDPPVELIAWDAASYTVHDLGVLGGVVGVPYGLHGPFQGSDVCSC